MKRKLFFVFLAVLVLLQPVAVLAADFSVVGRLVFDDIKSPSLVMDDLSVKGYVVGKPDLYYGDLNFTDEMRFNLELNDLKENNQLILVGEGKKGENGYFGSITTVITEKELTSGLIGDSVIKMNELPVPVYETSNDSLIKVCWRGLDEFSVVGYEVYRTENAEAGWDSVGRAGQNAGKQVCFVDNKADQDVTYYYRLGALTSWNAGDGDEVMASQVQSGMSDGMMIGLGVVDRINKVVSEEMIETDKTVVVTNNLEQNRYFAFFDSVVNKVNQFVADRGWSQELFMIAILSGILLIVILFFVISVSIANVRSRGSDLWNKK